jgi:type IV pilus assembly protein PilX
MNSNDAKGAHRRAGRERGSVLIVGLVILLVMTLVGVGATQVGTLEEKMAGNLRDQMLALEAAESALRQGERWLRELPVALPQGDLTCAASEANPGLYQGNCARAVNCLGTTTLWDTLECGGNAAWRDATRTRSFAGTLAKLHQTPSYVVEEIARLPSGNSEVGVATPVSVIYRITARSTGSSADTVAIVQSTFKK